MKDDFDSYSKEALEKLKLKVEIKNLKRSPLRHPSFWSPLLTLLIAALAYWWSWKSGYFDLRALKNQVDAQALKNQKDSLNQAIKEQQHIYDSLRHLTDSFKNEVANFRLIIEETKKKYRIEEEKKLTKLELQKEVFTLTKQIRSLLKFYKRTSDSISKSTPNPDDIAPKNNKLFEDVMEEYKTKYNSKVQQYFEQLFSYFPDSVILKVEGRDWQYDIKLPPVTTYEFDDISNRLDYWADRLTKKY
jgi:hypothetical protein